MSLTRKALSNRLANLVSRIRGSVVCGKPPAVAILGKDGNISSPGDPIALSLIACRISQAPHPVRIAVLEMAEAADVWGIMDFPGAVKARELRISREAEAKKAEEFRRAAATVGRAFIFAANKLNIEKGLPVAQRVNFVAPEFFADSAIKPRDLVKYAGAK